MGQRLQPWRSGDGERLWLSMLIDAMEEVSRPEFRSVSCGRSVLAAVSAQLAQPASAYPLLRLSFQPAQLDLKAACESIFRLGGIQLAARKCVKL
jgi:hypothetical protein